MGGKYRLTNSAFYGHKQTNVGHSAAGIFFLSIHLLISRVVLSSISTVLIVYESDRNDPIRVYYSIGYPAVFTERRATYSKKIPSAHAFSILGIALLGCYVLLATDTLFEPGFLIVFEYSGWFAVAAGVLILLALVSPRALYDRFLSWSPLRAIGLVGFSFYLLHPMVISLTREMQDHSLGFRLSLKSR